MKLATFEIATTAGPMRRIGALSDGRLVDLAAAYAAYLERTDPGCDAERLAALFFPSDMVAFLGSGSIGHLAALRAFETYQATDVAFGARTTYDCGEVRLLAPVPRPRVLRDYITFEGHMKQAGCRPPGTRYRPTTRAIRTPSSGRNRLCSGLSIRKNSTLSWSRGW